MKDYLVLIKEDKTGEYICALDGLRTKEEAEQFLIDRKKDVQEGYSLEMKKIN